MGIYVLLDLVSVQRCWPMDVDIVRMDLKKHKILYLITGGERSGKAVMKI
jgi:hypothetical protein